jgi:hypothetical protein
MSKLKVKTKYDDIDLDDDVEVVELEGETLIECISSFLDMDIDELKDYLKTGRWFGGEWIQKGSKIVFESDTFTIVYSLQ